MVRRALPPHIPQNWVPPMDTLLLAPAAGAEQELLPQASSLRAAQSSPRCEEAAMVLRLQGGPAADALQELEQ